MQGERRSGVSQGDRGQGEQRTSSAESKLHIVWRWLCCVGAQVGGEGGRGGAIQGEESPCDDHVDVLVDAYVALSEPTPTLLCFGTLAFASPTTMTTARAAGAEAAGAPAISCIVLQKA